MILRQDQPELQDPHDQRGIAPLMSGYRFSPAEL
jgi:hypothetical protein